MFTKENCCPEGAYKDNKELECKLQLLRKAALGQLAAEGLEKELGAIRTVVPTMPLTRALLHEIPARGSAPSAMYRLAGDRSDSSFRPSCLPALVVFGWHLLP